MLTPLQSRTLKQLNYPFHPEMHRKILFSSSWSVRRKKVVLQVPVHFFKHFLYICIYLLCFYYRIARIKLLASLASFIGAMVKAVSVKKINYLYRCGIEASSNYNLFYHYTLYPVALITSQSIWQMRIQKVTSIPSLVIFHITCMCWKLYSCHTTEMLVIFFFPDANQKQHHCVNTALSGSCITTCLFLSEICAIVEFNR